MFRYLIYALPTLVVCLALFGIAVDVVGLDVPHGAVVQLGWGEDHIPWRIVLGTWLLEAIGLAALYLLIQGRSFAWWLDGLLAGWIAWIFRAPLLTVTVVLLGHAQGSWWSLTVAWWILYSACGLILAILARRLLPEARGTRDETPSSDPSDTLSLP